MDSLREGLERLASRQYERAVEIASSELVRAGRILDEEPATLLPATRLAMAASLAGGLSSENLVAIIEKLGDEGKMPRSEVEYWRSEARLPARMHPFPHPPTPMPPAYGNDECVDLYASLRLEDEAREYARAAKIPFNPPSRSGLSPSQQFDAIERYVSRDLRDKWQVRRESLVGPRSEFVEFVKRSSNTQRPALTPGQAAESYAVPADSSYARARREYELGVANLSALSYVHAHLIAGEMVDGEVDAIARANSRVARHVASSEVLAATRNELERFRPILVRTAQLDRLGAELDRLGVRSSRRLHHVVLGFEREAMSGQGPFRIDEVYAKDSHQGRWVMGAILSAAALGCGYAFADELASLAQRLF